VGFLLAGTDEFLEDKRRGLYSYEALRSRLAESPFSGPDIKNFAGPVLRLQNLSPEDLFVLLCNIRHVHAFGDQSKYIVPDEALVAVLKKANETLGADYFKTPRDIVRSFVSLLQVLEQNPDRDWRSLLGEGFLQSSPSSMSVEEEITRGILPPPDADDDLHTLKLS
jgi:hypothetical protein